MGRYLNPRYSQAILVSGCTVLITAWMVTWLYNIRLQASKLARKCEIKHGLTVVRSYGRCTVT